MTKPKSKPRHKHDWEWVGSTMASGAAYWCQKCGVMKFNKVGSRTLYQRPTGEA